MKPLHLDYLDMIEIVSEGWRFYREHSREIFIIVAVIALPVMVVQLLLQNFQRNFAVQIFSPHMIWVELISLLWIPIGILSFCSLVSIAYMVERGIQMEQVNWFGAIRYGFTRIIPVYFSTIILVVILIFLFLAFIIPGVFFSVNWFFLPYVVSLRKLSGTKAFEYSMKLVKGHWWRMLSSCVFLLGFQLLFFVPIYLVLVKVKPPLIFIITIQTISLFIGSFFTVITTLFFLNVDYVHAFRNNGIIPSMGSTQPEMDSN